jgi:hypothetical protein
MLNITAGDLALGSLPIEELQRKKLGGRIRSGYEVHHINRNKLDNRPSNLTVISKSAHQSIHGRGRKSRPGRFRRKKWWGKI